MHGGEEQYLEGMLDWDGIPNRKYDEYKQIASEFKKIEKYFPYKQKAEVALAYSFDSHMSSFAFPETHEQQLQKAFEQFMFRNMDCRMIDISRSSLDYKLLILPGYAVMTEQDAQKIRRFVADGGTVIMTSNSAVVDETGKVFASTHPGRLNDVFGVRVASFEETAVMNEISTDGSAGYQITVGYNGKPVKVESARYDVMYPVTAKVLATITSLPGDPVIMTENTYGKGRAYYIGLPSGSGIMNDLMDSLIPEIGLKPGPDVPQGVMARDIDDKHSLYLNPTDKEQVIRISGKAKGILTGKTYKDEVIIPPFEVEFIEKR
jgi:beta-galactosidase